MVLVYSGNPLHSQAATLAPVLSPLLMEVVESALFTYHAIRRDELQPEVNLIPLSAKLIDD